MKMINIVCGFASEMKLGCASLMQQWQLWVLYSKWDVIIRALDDEGVFGKTIGDCVRFQGLFKNTVDTH